MLDFSDRTRTGISKLISRCALTPNFTVIIYLSICVTAEVTVDNVEFTAQRLINLEIPEAGFFVPNLELCLSYSRVIHELIK